MNNSVTVIFPAAGQSRRMKSDKNKNFLELEGKPILIHSLSAFSQVESINHLIVAASPDELEIVNEMINGVSGLKPVTVIAGGSERQYSIANALKYVSNDAELILVHDAARPLISIKTINEVIDAARIYGGAIAAVPATNTIKEIDDNKIIHKTLPRNRLIEVQTPQGFKREILIEAYERAAHEKFLGTDDSSLVERLGYKVKAVMSDYFNIKVTTPEDLMIAQALINTIRQGGEFN